MSHSDITEYITELRISHGYSRLYRSEVLGIGRHITTMRPNGIRPLTNRLSEWQNYTI